MIVRNLKSKALRAALACGTSLAAMALTPAHAQQREEHSAYMMRFASEIADGDSIISQSRDVVTARQRTGDRSIFVYDDQDGRATIERMGKTLVIPLTSRIGPERAYAYDYARQTLIGSDFLTANFNVIVRPLLVNAPTPDANAAWRVNTNLQQLALAAKSGGDVAMGLTRTYFESNGKQVALIEFDVPAFSYVAEKGETIVHWAHGFAVADPGFGEVYAFATQHRASAMSPDGVIRPISVRTSMHGIDDDGGWRASFDDVPQVQAAMKRVVETEGNAVHPTASDRSSAVPDSFPLTVASQLDFAAFGALEGGANPLATMIAVDPSAAGMFDSLGLQPSLLLPIAETVPVLTNFIADYPNSAAAQLPPAPQQPGSVSAALAQILSQNPEFAAEAMRQINNAGANTPSSPLPLVTEDGPGAAHMFYQLGLGGQTAGALLETALTTLTPALTSGASPLERLFVMSQDGTITLPPPLPPGSVSAAINRAFQEPGAYEAAVRDLNQQMPALRRAITSTDDGNSPDIDGLFTQIADAEEQNSIAMTAMLAALEEERLSGPPGPRTQDPAIDNLVSSPNWIEPNSQDAETHRLLVAEAERQLKATREAAERRKAEAAKKNTKPSDQVKADSGFGSNGGFYENNAFKFDSMVGRVPTDLSRWGAWLATQNVRELERLALQAGYPNLASALNDAKNILRQSQDRGYRDWAAQAPACGGYIGCGPNYLERWAMKQSIVILGDILNDSRDIFSSGGFSDIGISGLNLAYLLRDHATEDGDLVRVRISQFGRLLYEGQISLTNAGALFNIGLQRGVASVEIFAVNEGALSPNTAQITVDDIVRGEPTQTYSLQTGDTATLRVEAGAKAGAGQ